eukprot:1191474-Amphidinium_carterae.1
MFYGRCFKSCVLKVVVIYRVDDAAVCLLGNPSTYLWTLSPPGEPLPKNRPKERNVPPHDAPNRDY